jgi:hypothetical protein
MTRTIRTDYQAINGVGRVVYTFGDEASARAWAKDNAHLHDGLRIERLTVTAQAIYTPRPARRRPDFAIPTWAAVPRVQA